MAEATPGATGAALRRLRRWGWFGALVAGMLIAVLAGLKAQSKPRPNASDDALALAAEEALAAAMGSGDNRLARRLLSLQFSVVDGDGKVHGRKDVLGDLKAFAAAPAVDVKVKIYGLLAVVTGQRKTARGNDAFFLDIWAKQKKTWRILVMQVVALGGAPAVAAAPAATVPTKPDECRNPCQAIPYRVRSPAEQDIINAFQAIEKAVVAHDAGKWGEHVAEEYVHYGTDHAPLPKSVHIVRMEREKEGNAAVSVGEVGAMRLAVYGDGAAMMVSEAVPDHSRPPYRAARVWVKRNGRWQMAISADTDIK